jgi:hypothetical protein
MGTVREILTFKTMKRRWNIVITGSCLDDMENSGIFKKMKRLLAFET